MTLRLPAVAGQFYPGDAPGLTATVDSLLAAAGKVVGRRPKALIVPHAGYIYSGATAAMAFAAIAPWAHEIRRVVLLGPTHRVALAGVAIPTASHFATPLGDIPLDTSALARLTALPGVVTSDPAHAREHSLEVQLPFLQRVLPAFTLLPLAVGHADPDTVAHVLDAVWGGEETLIVVSSDLSHYLPYAEAQALDRITCRQVIDRQAHLRPEEACGAFPVNGLLLAARRHGLAAELLAACNSGDTAGDKSRVVGYAAFRLREIDVD